MPQAMGEGLIGVIAVPRHACAATSVQGARVGRARAMHFDGLAGGACALILKQQFVLCCHDFSPM